ncbi:MAG TPA: mersacidin/lichenicidin family type 2 lantibiotic [Ktedonobacteraceae bacterium]|nr:mersacidin/lichenicidin family type 2 lantibiotic [Ktedonobacteraceae bacterium]
MTTDQIINSWKNEDEDQPKDTPENPAGAQELSDEDLEQVEGGAGLIRPGSCNQNSC